MMINTEFMTHQIEAYNAKQKKLDKKGREKDYK